MNYVQIQQFLVLSKTMNMTKASKELYITQPALSHSLSKMEEELGLQLVYRDGNHLVMTDAGRNILEDFKEIEASYDKMFSHARMMSKEKKQKIVLGFSGSVAAFYSLFSYGILSSYKRTVIEKVFAEAAVIENMLQNGQLDFCITFPPLSGENIESRILINDPIGLAIAGRHPLLKKDKIRLEDLKPYELTLLTKDNPFGMIFDEIMAKKNIKLKIHECSFDEIASEIEKGRDNGDLIGPSSRKQFSSWYGRGYRWLPIADVDESLVTAISWVKDYLPFAKNSREKPLNLEISSILEASEYKLSNSLTFNIDYSAR
ncbi:MAG: LysR family transcriptional regulator [Firmicutes bacterium]|nr:LysR family transcriptional regulator [Bacillota bacterium]